MNLLLLKLLLTPALIGLASLAGRKWGHAISGWIVALPLTTGPIVFILALTHGPTFAAETAAGILAGGFSLVAFAVVYAHSAMRWSWPATLGLASIAFLAITALLRPIQVSLWPLWIAVLLALLIGLRLLPRATQARAVDTLPPRWDIPLRMIIATSFVILITGIAPRLGPHLAGLISPFPLFTATLAAFAQHQYGPSAALSVLRGLLLGLFSYASFMFTLALILAPAGIAVAFAAALIVVIIFQAISLWLLRARID